ncbi:hypothetical protein AB0D49_06425 [Streptomyces sp. NPDC048290]|uniref:hypothetical protein n=1 Tax=Streptomyces sp. NPDC048290 TaxID=3155811 RepID=UPI003438F548
MTILVRPVVDSPSEHPVLTVLDGPAPRPASASDARDRRPHAHWHLVPGPDGVPRLEAIWHTDHHRT